MDYQSVSDFDLAALLRSGSKGAFLEIYERYKVFLYQQAYKRLGDKDEVEDVLQELFIYLWDKRESIDVKTNFSSYLYVAMRNSVFQLYAKKKRAYGYLDSLKAFSEKGSFTTDLIIQQKEFQAYIDSAIQALPPRMREVYLLSREEGLTHKQIAERLGTSEQTVKTQMRNSLKLLRIKLGSLFFLLF